MNLKCLVVALVFPLLATQAYSLDCTSAAQDLDEVLSQNGFDTVGVTQLANILQTLNNTGALPDYFVTKAVAQRAGWKPGASLWSVKKLKGDSIGGDVFTNVEGSLPSDSWNEADLDYNGGHRNAKRIVYSPDNQRYVTTDHYSDFFPVEDCQ